MYNLKIKVTLEDDSINEKIVKSFDTIDELRMFRDNKMGIYSFPSKEKILKELKGGSCVLKMNEDDLGVGVYTLDNKIIKKGELLIDES